MPSFDYSCKRCGRDFEVVVPSLSAEKDTRCPKCGSENTRRRFSPPNISMGGHSACEENQAPSCGSCCHGGACGF